MSLLSVQNLGKAYRSYSSEWKRFASWFGIKVAPCEEHWVLRNVNFDIQPGEAIGIIGQNGAGKSTFLKIITGTLQPTEGQTQVNGRIAAILELGMGFNPELTGRQNAKHVLGLMGSSLVEIERVMQELESFAEIGEYFDQPIRTYSSGMQMRVAFAVITSFRPDLLIVDEALSVGDAAFQRKCFGRIDSFRKEGTSLLLVSHDVETIKRLCERAILLCNGAIQMQGTAKDICDSYEKQLFGETSNNIAITKEDLHLGQFDTSLKTSSIEKEYGNGDAKIFGVAVTDESGASINILPEGASFNINYKVKFKRKCLGIKFGMTIKTVEGIAVYAAHTEESEFNENLKSDEIASITFSLKGNLVSGTYYLNVGTTHLIKEETQFLHRRVDCLIFRITKNSYLPTSGYANLFGKPHIECIRLNSSTEKNEGFSQ